MYCSGNLGFFFFKARKNFSPNCHLGWAGIGIVTYLGYQTFNTKYFSIKCKCFKVYELGLGGKSCVMQSGVCVCFFFYSHLCTCDVGTDRVRLIVLISFHMEHEKILY